MNDGPYFLSKNIPGEPQAGAEPPLLKNLLKSQGQPFENKALTLL